MLYLHASTVLTSLQHVQPLIPDMRVTLSLWNFSAEVSTSRCNLGGEGKGVALITEAWVGWYRLTLFKTKSVHFTTEPVCDKTEESYIL